MLTEEKLLLIRLIMHKKFSIYDFYASSSLSTGQIARALLKYQKKGYLIIIGRFAVRTPYGIWKLRRVKHSQLSANNRYWARVPEALTTRSIMVNEPIAFKRISRR